jgi:putative salt-induced outer membrane protein YdiY
MHNRIARYVFVAIVALGFSAVKADDIIFKNGDHLTGKVDGYDGSKLTVSGTPAGTVSIELKNVKTFSTADAVNVVLKDGTVLHQKIVASPDGQIALPPGSPIQHVPFANLKAINPPPIRWTGNVVVGGTLTRGNTDTDDFNASLHLEHKTEKDRLSFDAGYLYSREHIQGGGFHETQNNWFGEAKYEDFFNKKLYGYGDVRAEQDVIADIDLRLTPGVGLGYQWIDTPKWKFNTEAGISWLYRSYSNDGSNESVSARLAYHLTGKLNDKVSVIHDFEYFPGLDRISNYYFNTDFGIRADITKTFFTQFKVEYRYDSQPAPGRGSNDLRYILGVGVNF